MPEFKITGNGTVETIDIWTGDVIKDTTDDNNRFKVIKVNPKNYRCLGTDGRQWNIPRDSRRFVKDENQSWDGPKEKTPHEIYSEVLSSGIVLGTAIEFTAPNLKNKYPGTYVVVAKKSDGTFNAAKLNGDNDRYLRKLNASQVKVVNV